MVRQRNESTPLFTACGWSDYTADVPDEEIRKRLLALNLEHMKPTTSPALKRGAVRQAAERFRTVNPRVFGSVVHGDDADGSDLGPLVGPLPGTTLFDLDGLQVELEALLGVPVDLLMRGDFPIKFRAQVLAEARPV